jgi:hypothetical protein
VTKLDKDRADFDEAVAICQRVFGDGVLPLYLPLAADDGAPAGLIGIEFDGLPRRDQDTHAPHKRRRRSFPAASGPGRGAGDRG